MKKILVLSFYYQPDLCAGSFRTTALIKSLNKTGVDIDVITTAPNRYASFKEKVESFKIENGVRVHRVTIPSHNSNMFDQSLSFISYYRQVTKLAKKSNYDIVFATSSRLFTAFLGARIASKIKAPLYLDIRDIFVDTMSDVLPAIIGFFINPILNLIENYTFTKAKHINLVSEGFFKYFKEKKLACTFSFFTNGIDKEFEEVIYPEKLMTNNNQKVSILYAGNIGEGQGLHKILPALAERLREEINIIVIGDGGLKEELKNSISSLAINNIDIRAPIKRNQLIDEYLKADVLFLHLNDYQAFKKVLPSKLFEYAAFSKPILAGLSGYSADFIDAEISDCEVFIPCDIDDAVKKFKRLNLIVKPRRDFIEKYKRENIMNMMAENILSVLKDGVHNRLYLKE